MRTYGHRETEMSLEIKKGGGGRRGVKINLSGTTNTLGDGHTNSPDSSIIKGTHVTKTFVFP